MPATLSIIIPSHNRPDLLRRCLKSVLQNAPEHTEIIVVDDGSPEECVRRVAEEFPGVIVHRHGQRRGFCIAVNAGVSRAKGEIIELLNDDTEVSAGWTQVPLTRFDDPTIGAVTPLIFMGTSDTSDPRVDSAGDRYHLGGVAGKRGHGKRLSESYQQPGFVFGACGAASFYRREVYLRVGGMPAEFGAYFDDVDLSFRIHQAGYRIFYEPASRIYHHVSASHGRPTGDLLIQQSRNEEMVFWRNLPTRELWNNFVLHLGVLTVKAVRRFRERELVPFLWGRLEAWARLPRLLRHRRERCRNKGIDVGGWNVERGVRAFFAQTEDPRSEREFTQAPIGKLP